MSTGDSIARTEEEAPWNRPRAVYVHVPFCRHHCGYCDFAVTAGQDGLFESYLSALAREMDRRVATVPIETIFIGGGTPTYLPAPLLQRMLSDINRRFGSTSLIEFSIEATPESLDEEKLAVLRSAGVNRVSLGVQTFDDDTLSTLDRIHCQENIRTAVTAVRSGGFRMSLDLIFGVPGQTIPGWTDDLSRAVALSADHLSTYGLTYEKGTPLWKRREKGTIIPLGDDVEAEMYELAMRDLVSDGYEHYEISNFARPGMRCRHNETYWANHAYYGFGVGAAAYVDGERTLNCRNTVDYIRRIGDSGSAVFQAERLPPQERALETAAVQLRRSDGIRRQAFERQTGFELDRLLLGDPGPYVSAGLLIDDSDGIRLTPRGRCLADSLVSRVVWG